MELHAVLLLFYFFGTIFCTALVLATLEHGRFESSSQNCRRCALIVLLIPLFHCEGHGKRNHFSETHKEEDWIGINLCLSRAGSPSLAKSVNLLFSNE